MSTIAYVRWRDASHGATEMPIAEAGLAELEEVGFLVRETPEYVVLTMERQEGYEDGDIRLWLTIPRVNIVEMHKTTLRRAFRVGAS